MRWPIPSGINTAIRIWGLDVIFWYFRSLKFSEADRRGSPALVPGFSIRSFMFRDGGDAARLVISETGF
jgi:hypothetical protein